MFRMLRSLFRFKRLRSRFFAAMIVISLGPLIILGYTSFHIAKNTLTDTNARTYKEHLAASSQVADMLFRNVINLNRSLVVNNDIRQDLIRKSPENILKQEERSVNRVDKTVNTSMLDTRFIKSICVMDLKFKSSCSGRSDDAGIYEGNQKEQLITESTWYRETTQAQGAVLFYSDDILDRSKGVFTTTKLFRDALSGEPIGLLLIAVYKDIFDEVFIPNPSDGYMVLDNTRQPAVSVYTSPSLQNAVLQGDSLDTVMSGLRGQGYLVSAAQNRVTDWTFLHVIKTSELTRQSKKIGSVTTLLATSMALLSLLLAFFLSGTITRPLLQIKKMLIDWMQGGRVYTGTFPNDEVGTIGETFKRLASENKELNEKLVSSELKEKEAELRALQAQIKPHFLYNTLDSIYWMATIQKNHEIARMAVSLSESFKLSLNKGKELISVFKELKHIEHYMTIQNLRYNDRFQYVELVDHDIMGMEIMKLLLQPLVENAIYHGLEPKVGPGRVSLTGRRDGDFLVFTVEDDGVGMEDISVTAKGYGLNNVRERLLLFYGASSSIDIQSERGAGTRICIRFKP